MENRFLFKTSLRFILFSGDASTRQPSWNLPRPGCFVTMDAALQRQDIARDILCKVTNTLPLLDVFVFETSLWENTAFGALTAFLFA